MQNWMCGPLTNALWFDTPRLRPCIGYSGSRSRSCTVRVMPNFRSGSCSTSLGGTIGHFGPEGHLLEQRQGSRFKGGTRMRIHWYQPTYLNRYLESWRHAANRRRWPIKHCCSTSLKKKHTLLLDSGSRVSALTLLASGRRLSFSASVDYPTRDIYISVDPGAGIDIGNTGLSSTSIAHPRRRMAVRAKPSGFYVCVSWGLVRGISTALG